MSDKAWSDMMIIRDNRNERGVRQTDGNINDNDYGCPEGEPGDPGQPGLVYKFLCLSKLLHRKHQ